MFYIVFHVASFLNVTFVSFVFVSVSLSVQVGYVVQSV